MIGHFLLSVSPEMEDVLLTTAMRPLVWKNGVIGDGPCLIMAMSQANVGREWKQFHPTMVQWLGVFVGWQFDSLCHRFGTERVTRAIRNRILSNQARRVLQEEMAEV